MNQKICKKCKKPLPEDYRYHLCEYCRNQKIEKIKKGSAIVGSAVGAVAIGVIKLIKK